MISEKKFSKPATNFPKVSVVMATYNGKKFIEEQIESILNQTYSNFELIIVDDCSDNETVSIIKGFTEKDNRIRFYPSSQNLGFIKNFERGLNFANGDFIALSDQDDIFHSDKLTVLLEVLLENESIDLVVSDLRLVSKNRITVADSMWEYHKSNPSTGKPFTRLLLGNFATGCAMMFTRRLLNLVLPFPPNILVHDWWIALVASTGKAGGIRLVDRALVDYRQHTSNVVGAKPLRQLSFKTLLPYEGEKSELGRIIQESRAEWPKDLLRIEGYLDRSDLWSEEEVRHIEITRAIYQGLCLDNEKFWLWRVAQLPARLKCFIHTKRVRTCMKVVVTTLWPSSK